MSGVLIAVTDHAADRFRQRVRGTLDAKAEIVARVSRAWAAGRTREGRRGTVDVLDERDPGRLRPPTPGLRGGPPPRLVFVCRHDVPRGELVVVTLWEEGGDARVPRRFTDAVDG